MTKNMSHKFISSQARLAHVGTLLISVRSEPAFFVRQCMIVQSVTWKY